MRILHCIRRYFYSPCVLTRVLYVTISEPQRKTPKSLIVLMVPVHPFAVPKGPMNQNLGRGIGGNQSVGSRAITA
jgi:hypothetical protein